MGGWGEVGDRKQTGKQMGKWYFQIVEKSGGESRTRNSCYSVPLFWWSHDVYSLVTCTLEEVIDTENLSRQGFAICEDWELIVLFAFKYEL